MMQNSRNKEGRDFVVEEQVTRKGLWIVLGFLILSSLITDIHSWYFKSGDHIQLDSPTIPSYLSYFVNIHGFDASETGYTRKRFLFHQDTPPTPNNDGDNNNSDIDPHNKICRNYLKSFLEGTTDTNDECQGLQNAYSAADCQEDIIRRTLNTVDESIHENNSTNDDDEKSKSDDTPTIDDFFQEFQCTCFIVCTVIFGSYF